MIQRPTRKELVERTEAAIESRLTHEQMHASNAKAYARAFAGIADALYSRVVDAHRQQFVTTCDGDYLDLHGTEYGVTRRQATFATGAITFDLSGGGNVPSGTILQSSVGIQYRTTENASQAGNAPVQAVLSGRQGNIPLGAKLALVSPISGVNAEATVTTAIEGGTDTESDNAFRERVLLRMRETPMGGSKQDYIEWALEVPNVSKAWCYPLEGGAPNVGVRFLENGGIPSAAKVAEVDAYIRERKPVTAVLTVSAPVAQAVNFVFSDIEPADATTQAQIRAELEALFAAEAEPKGQGITGTILISHIRAAISAAAGETDYALTTPNADITPNAVGKILTLGTITYGS